MESEHVLVPRCRETFASYVQAQLYELAMASPAGAKWYTVNVTRND